MKLLVAILTTQTILTCLSYGFKHPQYSSNLYYEPKVIYYSNLPKKTGNAGGANSGINFNSAPHIYLFK